MTEIRAVLRQGQHLFTPRTPAPYDGQFQTSSAFEDILSSVRAARLSDPLTITIHDEDTRKDRDHVAALRGAAKERQRIARAELRALNRNGLRVLALGLVVMAVCMLASALTRTQALPFEFLRSLFAEGLIIAGWVALWRPIEMLLYDTMPYRRELRLLNRLDKLQVSVIRGE